MTQKPRLIFLLAAVIVTACHPSSLQTIEKSEATTLPEIITTTWKITLINSESIKGDSSNYYLKLDATSGRFESKAGCNQIIGEFKINNGFISFSKVASTKMYCLDTMQTEELYLSILATPSTYRMSNSSKLLFLKDGIVVAQFDAL